VHRLARGVAYRSTSAWSPDGKRLAFVRADGIYVMSADGARVAKVVACSPPDCYGVGGPSWSSDASRLAFLRAAGDRDGLWVVDPDGSGRMPLQLDFQSILSLAWSPDGHEIAVVGNMETGPLVDAPRIYFVNATTGEVARSLSAPGGLEFAGTVQWSPDERWLAFDAVGSGGTVQGQGIYLMKPDGTGSHLLTSCGSSNCMDLNPAWSPDGSTIAFTRGLDSERGSDGFVGDIYVVDVATGRLRRVTGGPGLDCCPSWQAVSP
jgi:Tol biopolymer transport system component